MASTTLQAPGSRQPRKSFIPLESNPTVFTELIHKLGVSKDLAFHDVWTLDDPVLLALVPRPVHALVLVFPAEGLYTKQFQELEANMGEYDGFGDQEDVFFFKQTIHNACGLYGILHAVCNGEARDKLDADSTLARLIQRCTPLEWEARAKALEDDGNVEAAYSSVATNGETEAPEAESEVDFHYICFVKSKKNGHLYLLDGDRKRPLDMGKLEGEDLLSEDSVDLVKGFIESMKGESIGFSLMALGPNSED